MLLLFSLFFLFLLLLYPDVCLQGAKNGLILWFENVLPTLFPFMVLSLFMVKTGVSTRISKACPAFLQRLLGIPKAGIYPVIIGMLSGMPVGAKTVATLYGQGELSPAESEYLLCLCNNISPAFLLSFIGSYCLGLGPSRYALLVILYVSAFFSARILKPLWKNASIHSVPAAEKTVPSCRHLSHTPWIAALNAAIMESLHTLAFVGGYIILFSLLGNVILSFSSNHITGIATLLLEITTGSSFLRTSAIYSPAQKIILLGAFSSFGGLSSIAQTSSVVTSSGLSVIRYSAGKLVQAFIAGILCFLFFFVIRNHW